MSQCAIYRLSVKIKKLIDLLAEGQYLCKPAVTEKSLLKPLMMP